MLIPEPQVLCSADQLTRPLGRHHPQGPVRVDRCHLHAWPGFPTVSPWIFSKTCSFLGITVYYHLFCNTTSHSHHVNNCRTVDGQNNEKNKKNKTNPVVPWCPHKLSLIGHKRFELDFGGVGSAVHTHRQCCPKITMLQTCLHRMQPEVLQTIAPSTDVRG